MGVHKISDHVYATPIVDGETDLFESLWPIDDGVNYNSYVVVGSDGAAIIDTVHENFFREYLDALEGVVDLEKVKYVVLNHLEPDHSSSLLHLLDHLPNANVVVSPVAKTMFALPEDSVAVKDGDTLSLGSVSLQFRHTPWTHWPETMITFVPEDRVVFTCDIFGAYGSYPDLDTDDWDDYVLEARRYYVTVLSKYAQFVRSALDKIRALKPSVVAPGHGIVYTGERLAQIFDLYDSWVQNRPEGRVVILYGSMYGSVYRAVDTLSMLLKSEGVEVDVVDLSRDDWSYAMTLILGADVVVVAYPAYDAGVFLPVKYFIQTVVDKGLVAGRPVYVLEAHGWSPTEAAIRAILGNADIRRFISFSQKTPISMDAIEELAEEISSLISR